MCTGESPPKKNPRTTKSHHVKSHPNLDIGFHRQRGFDPDEEGTLVKLNMGELSLGDPVLSKGETFSPSFNAALICLSRRPMRSLCALSVFGAGNSSRKLFLLAGCPWSEEEHKAFLRGLESLGKVRLSSYNLEQPRPTDLARLFPPSGKLERHQSHVRALEVRLSFGSRKALVPTLVHFLTNSLNAQEPDTSCFTRSEIFSSSLWLHEAPLPVFRPGGEVAAQLHTSLL